TVLQKLLQKSHIALKEQLQIIKPVFQHSDAVHAHAEGEAGNLYGIVAVMLHELEHVGINHAAAENFDPSGLLARTARGIVIASPPAPAADKARNEHLRARFCERKERRTKA